MFLDICNVKKILTMIARIKLLCKSYLDCSDASFALVFEVFALQVILGPLVSPIAYFLSLQACNSVNFQPICKILNSKDFIILGQVYLPMSLFILSLFFNI